MGGWFVRKSFLQKSAKVVCKAILPTLLADPKLSSKHKMYGSLIFWSPVSRKRSRLAQIKAVLPRLFCIRRLRTLKLVKQFDDLTKTFALAPLSDRSNLTGRYLALKCYFFARGKVCSQTVEGKHIRKFCIIAELYQKRFWITNFCSKCKNVKQIILQSLTQILCKYLFWV